MNMSTVLSTKVQKGGRRGALHKELERHMMKMMILGEEECAWG